MIDNPPEGMSESELWLSRICSASECEYQDLELSLSNMLNDTIAHADVARVVDTLSSREKVPFGHLEHPGVFTCIIIMYLGLEAWDWVDWLFGQG